MTSPRLVVVIPAHNAAATVASAVASAARQTLRPAAILVVDDGSSDGTGAEAKRAGATVIRHQQARGAAAARDAGARHLPSDAVAFLDADDALHPGHLEAAAATLRRAPAASLIFGRSVEIREDGTHRSPPIYSSHALRHPLWALAWNNLVPTSATVVPSWAYQASGGFDPAFPGSAAEDFDLWLRLACLGPFAFTGEVAVHRTVTSGSTSRRDAALELMLRNGLVAVERITPRVVAEHPWFPRVAGGHIRREAARRFLANGLRERAQQEARLAVRCNPADRGAWELLALSHAPGAAVRAAMRIHAWRQDQRVRRAGWT